jgi:hypothetical protein
MQIAAPRGPVATTGFPPLKTRRHFAVFSLMPNKIRGLTPLLLAAVGFGQLATPSSAPGAGDPPNEEPLQMIVDYGQSQLNRRETHHGVMETVGVPANLSVTITLRFLKKRAGAPVTIGRLDGGEIDLAGPVTIASDGTVLFHFSAGGLPGLYRLMVDGPEHYEIALYAIDPNRAPRSANFSGH